MVEPPSRPSRGTVLWSVVGIAAAGTAIVWLATEVVGSDVPAVLAFSGTLVVAVVTAVATWTTTSYRQAQQIAADQERQSAQLQAEHEHHAERLAHERSLQEVQNLLSLFDECAAAYERSRAAALSFVSLLALPPAGPLRAERYPEQLSSFIESTRKVTEHLHRLEMRFAPDHAVVTTYRSVAGAVDARRNYVMGLEPGPAFVITAEQNDEDTRNGSVGLAAYDLFAAAARKEVGVAREQARATEEPVGH